MRKAFFAVTLVLLMLALAAPVMAAEGAPPEVPLQWVHSIWSAAKATPIAIVMALITSLAGYFSKTAPENFKLENFLFTVLISFLVGFLSIYAGWSYANIELWLANGFLTWYIWKVAKIIARKSGLQKQPTATTGPGPPGQV
jgi:type IV secretory pathway VirB2 component (pilin)